MASERSPQVENKTPRQRWVIEAVCGLAVAFGVSRLLGMQLPGFDFMALVAVAIAARYGFVPGAVAGLLAAALKLLAAGSGPGAFLSFTADRTAVPGALALALAAALVGLIADIHLRALSRERMEAGILAERLAALQDRYDVVAAAKIALDRRVIGQAQSIMTTYEAARELEVLDPPSVLPAAARLTARFLEADAVAIYELDGFRLRLVASHGEHPGRPSTLTIEDNVLGSVVRTGTATAVRSKADYERSRVLLAAPLKRLDGSVRGVIAVERLPFEQLTPAVGQLLDLVADWAGRALARSEAFDATQEGQAVHRVTGVYTLPHMLGRLEEEWTAARRYGLPLAALLVRQPTLLTQPPERRAEAAMPLVHALKRLVREVDLLGHYRTDDSFLLLLPNTDVRATQALAERVAALQPELIVVEAHAESFTSAEVLLQALQIQAFDMQEA
jgi:hypothetical protein